MKQFLVMLSVAVVLGGAADSAAAQRIDSPYRFLDYGQFLGPYAGYIDAKEGQLGNGPQPGSTFGATWAIRLSGPFSIGADVGYLPTTRTVRDTVWEESEGQFRAIGEADVKMVLVMGNVRLNLTGARTWNGLQPFALLGAGAVLDLAGGAEIEEDLDTSARYDFGTSFAGLLGAGVDWFPTSRISLRLDARNLLWKLNTPEAFRLTENGRTLTGSEWERNLAVTAGVSVHF